jgi:hypothetical protein
VKPLSQGDEELARVLALALTDAMVSAIPSLFGESPDAVVAVMLPIASQLVRYERKARRNRKAARRYRKLCRETGELLRTEDSALVRPEVLPGTVPFDASEWHTALAPGIGSEHLEVP